MLPDFQVENGIRLLSCLFLILQLNENFLELFSKHKFFQADFFLK
jgi:hypothetical protein